MVLALNRNQRDKETHPDLKEGDINEEAESVDFPPKDKGIVPGDRNWGGLDGTDQQRNLRDLTAGRVLPTSSCNCKF